MKDPKQRKLFNTEVLSSAGEHALLARARARSALKSLRQSEVNISAAPVTGPGSGQTHSSQSSPGQTTQSSSTRAKNNGSSHKAIQDGSEPELHFPTETRYFEVAGMKRCPICHQRHRVSRTLDSRQRQEFKVAQPIDQPCDYGAGTVTRYMQSTVRAWNLMVLLAKS